MLGRVLITKYLVRKASVRNRCNTKSNLRYWRIFCYIKALSSCQNIKSETHRSFVSINPSRAHYSKRRGTLLSFTNLYRQMYAYARALFWSVNQKVHDCAGRMSLSDIESGKIKVISSFNDFAINYFKAHRCENIFYMFNNFSVTMKTACISWNSLPQWRIKNDGTLNFPLISFKYVFLHQKFQTRTFSIFWMLSKSRLSSIERSWKCSVILAKMPCS